MRKAMRGILTAVLMLMVTGAGMAYAAEQESGGAATANKDKALAKVGDYVVTQSYLDEMIAAMPEPQRAQLSTPEGKKQLLNNIVEAHMFANEAVRRKLNESASAKCMMQNMMDQVLASEYVRYLRDQVKVSDEDVKAYYEQNKDRFKQAETVKARHILVKTEDEAKAVLAELEAGKDFGQLAAEKSTCPSKARGGDLGWFEKGRMVPEFDTAAFALKKGERSGVVQTQFGYHIILVEDRREAGQKSLADAKPEIEEQLKREKFMQALTDEKTRLKKSEKVEILDPAFK